VEQLPEGGGVGGAGAFPQLSVAELGCRVGIAWTYFSHTSLCPAPRKGFPDEISSGCYQIVTGKYWKEGVQ
jgi:hypothetical protein